MDKAAMLQAAKPNVLEDFHVKGLDGNKLMCRRDNQVLI